MAELQIRIKKKTDGSAALSCTRADGSVTWQRQSGRLGGFFPRHDLTHFAVETALGHRRGFYGLLADGWDITDFDNKRPIPDDMDPSELIVGFLDVERATGGGWSAEEFNERATAFFADHGGSTRLDLTEAELDAVREMRRDLFARWAALPAGEALELAFDRTTWPVRAP